MDARQAFVSTVFYPADPSSSWWVLEPGQTLVYMTGTSSAGSVLQRIVRISMDHRGGVS